MRIKNKIYFSLIILIFTISISFLSCKKDSSKVLKMATTTSTDNTGLLDYLKPHIKTGTGINIQWVAVGTGKALELGKNCDVDILFVHAPSTEKKYVNEGHGINRKQVMFNDFIIIGPESDPVKISGKSVRDAFKAIITGKAAFASRGDNSGTNKKEIKLWKSARLKVPDRESWYLQTGQGMINTITVAAERNAYTLTDRGTYIKYEANHKGNPPLVILVEGDENLKNQYSVIAINPDKCKDVKVDLANIFIRWVISPDAQRLIGDFKLMEKRLFTPNAGK